MLFLNITLPKSETGITCSFSSGISIEARHADHFASLGVKMTPNPNKARHSRASTRILKEWFRDHQSYPYPTEDQKESLKDRSGLSIRQISQWFVNARRRNTVKPDAQEAPTDAPEQLPSSSSHGPEVPQADAWGSMGPLDRWRNSPPDTEPAPWAAIERAVESTALSHSTKSASNPSLSWNEELDSGRSLLPSDSASSVDFPSRRSQSQSSNSSAHSYSSGSATSLQSWGSHAGSRRRRQRDSKRGRRRPKNPLVEEHKRIYQCTFCTDSFRSKYDWTRHERTLHLTLEKWTCSPSGPVYQKPGEATVRCVFCDEIGPSPEHLELHGANKCVVKPPGARSFYRKDHFRQHLRLSHNVDRVLPLMKGWLSRVDQITSRCGFCQETFTLWSERNDHLATHFRNGALMKDWKGCRGLEPAVSLLVQDAMPPYLIGLESRNFEPFSASRGTVKKPQSGADNKRDPPTVFQLLTAQLGDFVKTSMAKNLRVTDEMIQREARLIIYDDDDPWNQTPADNPEWLDLFKTGYGLFPTTRAQDPVTSQLHSNQASTQHSTATVPSPVTLEKLYQAAASDIGADHLEFCARGPAVPGFAVPWQWQSPECLADFIQRHQIPPLATLGTVESVTQPTLPAGCAIDSASTGDTSLVVDHSGIAMEAESTGVDTPAAPGCGVPAFNHNAADESLTLLMSEEDLFSSILSFDMEPQAVVDKGR